VSDYNIIYYGLASLPYSSVEVYI